MPKNPNETDLIDVKRFAATPGVHLNMPEELYFGVDAIGSSDLKVLLRDPASWWYGSRHNPNRRPALDKKDSPKVLGSALHTLLLESVEAYEDQFAIEPDADELTRIGQKPFNQISEIRKFLEKKGVDTYNANGLPALAKLAKQNGYGSLVFYNLKRDYERRISEGRQIISMDADRRLRHMAHLVTNHPDLGPGLKLGYSEVSVLFYHPHLPDQLTRVRFDKLTKRWIGDLKTMGNWVGRTLKQSAVKEITEREYDIQRRLYHDGRVAFAEHVQKGNVFAWEEGRPVQVLARERQDLAEIADQETWDWVWIFYQMQNNTEGKSRAPGLIPFIHSADGQAWDQATEKLAQAYANYKTYLEANGTEQPWATIEPFTPLTDADLSNLMYKGVN